MFISALETTYKKHQKKKQNGTTNKQAKPYRPCPFCSRIRSRLSDHMKKKHSDEPEVKAAKRLPELDSHITFALLRKKGIMKANLKLVQTKHPSGKVELIRERKQSSGDIVYCSTCYAFVSKAYFNRHRKTCCLTETSIIAPVAIPSTICSASGVPEEFKTEILRSFSQDDVGKNCTTDELIVGYGCREFQNFQQKKDKRDERKAALRSDMRNLGRLYTHFKEKCQERHVQSLSAVDMFQRKNFKILEAAITILTAKEDGGSKSSLKISLGYLLKKVAKYIHGERLIAEKEEEALQIERFLAVLKFHWGFLFGDAEYSISMQRQTHLRKPHILLDKD